MGKVKGGGEENTKGQKAKLQKKEAMTKKQAKVEGQKKAKEDEHWQVGANSREEKRAADAAAKDAAKLAKKEAKSAALKAEEEELSKMRAPKVMINLQATSHRTVSIFILKYDHLRIFIFFISHSYRRDTNIVTS